MLGKLKFYLLTATLLCGVACSPINPDEPNNGGNNGGGSSQIVYTVTEAQFNAAKDYATYTAFKAVGESTLKVNASCGISHLIKIA